MWTKWFINLNWKRCCNKSVCKITVEFATALKVNVFIFFFCLNIQLFLCRMIDKESTFLFRFTVKLTFNALNLFSLLNNWMLLDKTTSADSCDDIVVLEFWFWLSSYIMKILNCCWWCNAFISEAFDTLNKWIKSNSEFAEACFLFLFSCWLLYKINLLNWWNLRSLIVIWSDFNVLFNSLIWFLRKLNINISVIEMMYSTRKAESCFFIHFNCDSADLTCFCISLM